LLDGIEKAGNKVPHPVMMFLYLIVFVIVLSQILALAGVSVTETIAEPKPIPTIPDYNQTTEYPGDIVTTDPYETEFEIHEVAVPIKGLLTIAGIRFIFTTFVSNFQGFGVVAITFIAMMGAGVAESAGLMGALIRKMVAVAPRKIVAFLIVFVGALSSVASDAGYLILIPLAAAAFLSLGRHPVAGMAAGFAGVAGTFAVNLIIQPIDAMITEIANEAIGTAAPHLTVVNNFFFAVVSLLVLCLVITLITERMIEPRLGAYDATQAAPAEAGSESSVDTAAEAKGLRYALYGFLGMLAIVLLATAPPGAPLRDPVDGKIIGTTPFMDSLLFIIVLMFLVSGVCYGIGAGTVKSSNDVIAAITKTFSSLAGLVFMLLMIAQFIAYFNYTNMPRVAAIALAHLLEAAGIPALPLLVGFILVIILLDFIIPNVIPKWAIFAPVFIPIFIRLNVPPQTVLAAYRIGDSPVNTLTPLMVYLPFIVTIAQKYQKGAGIGTVLALMIPYALAITAVWVILFILWFVLGIPLGPGYPISS